MGVFAWTRRHRRFRLSGSSQLCRLGLAKIARRPTRTEQHECPAFGPQREENTLANGKILWFKTGSYLAGLPLACPRRELPALFAVGVEGVREQFGYRLLRKRERQVLVNKEAIWPCGCVDEVFCLCSNVFERLQPVSQIFRIGA